MDGGRMGFDGWRQLFRRKREGAPGEDGETGLTDESVLSSLRLHLADVDQVPVLSDLTHVRAFAPGLAEILVVALPTSVIAPPAGELARFGSPAELVARGRSQLAELLADIGDTIEVRHITTPDQLTFTGLMGDSLSVASLAILLPEVVELLHPGADTSKGVFCAMPNASHLVLRVVDDVASLMAVGPMSVFARNGYQDRGATSPHVYWAHGPGLTEHTPLTRHEENEIAIHVPSELSSLLDT